ncbi:hypothetical protein Tco_1124059 [Tanacetum coccineum]|uniref:Reverse transcriptase domain-containing protein n=1 Tax=Tanacetum coccineum TaxID=301880 RepID=A0ABQ5J579_9ASTR
MPPRRNKDTNDIYEQELEQCINTRMDERFDQFVDQFVDRMNNMINPIRREDRNGRRSEGEESEYPYFKGDGSSSDELGDYGFVEKRGLDEEEDNIKVVVVVANVFALQ